MLPHNGGSLDRTQGRRGWREGRKVGRESGELHCGGLDAKMGLEMVIEDESGHVTCWGMLNGRRRYLPPSAGNSATGRFHDRGTILDRRISSTS